MTATADESDETVERRGPIYFEEPRFAKWLFGSSTAAWIWLIARLWLGWEWLQSGWSKVFGGTITLRFWDWGDPAYSLTGDGNIGWVRSSGDVGVGDAVAGFASNAIQSAEGPHPDVAYGWYVDFSNGSETPRIRGSGQSSRSGRSPLGPC